MNCPLHRRKRTWIVLALLVAAALVYIHRTDLAACFHEFGLQDIRDGVLASGPWAPLVCILLNALFTVLILPTTLVSILVALLFGVAWGLPICLAGLGLGMASSFLIARHLVRDWLKRRIGDTRLYHHLEENMHRDGWKLVLFSRLLPVNPYSFLNYAYGLTDIPFGRYLLASVAGIIPNVLALLWTTHAAGQLATGQMDWRILILLFSGAGLFAVLAWLPRFLRRKRPDVLPSAGEENLPEPDA